MNCTWEEDLAKEIVVADDVHLTLAELAMHCLWEITYWGFSPDEREETWQRKFGPKVLTNKYEVALDKLEESIWRHQSGGIKLHADYAVKGRTDGVMSSGQTHVISLTIA